MKTKPINRPWAWMWFPALHTLCVVATGMFLVVFEKLPNYLSNLAFWAPVLAFGVLYATVMFWLEVRARERDRGVPVPLADLVTGQTYRFVGAPGRSRGGALHAITCVTRPNLTFVVEVEPQLQHDFERLRQVSENGSFTYYARSEEVPNPKVNEPMIYLRSTPFVAEAPEYGFSLVGKAGVPLRTEKWDTGLPTVGATPSH